MPFDPNFPPFNAELVSAEWRTQLNALHAENTALAATVAAQAGLITTLQQAVAQLQQQVADNLADTSHNIWGQMPNLDPNYQPSDPPVAGDILWVVARMIEFNNGLARG